MVSCSLLGALLDKASMEAMMTLKTSLSHRCSIQFTTKWQPFWDHQSIQQLSMALATMSFLHNIFPPDFNQSARFTTSHNMVVYQWLTLPMELDVNRNESIVHRLFEILCCFFQRSVMEILKRHVSRIWLPVSNVNGCAEIEDSLWKHFNEFSL